MEQNIVSKISLGDAENALITLVYNLPDWAKYDLEIANAANLLKHYLDQQNEVTNNTGE